VSTVFPVPGLPATRTVKPLGIPPSIRVSRPETPVEIRSTIIMKIYKNNIKSYGIILTYQFSVSHSKIAKVSFLNGILTSLK
jgi:hypothetical protein